MSSSKQIAQALAGSPPQFLNPSKFDSQGLEQPPEVTQAIVAMLTPGLAGAAQEMGASAPARLASEAGAIFPESATPEVLPGIVKGAKTGDPHALYAYTDNFGPGGTPRKMFNIFGDPAHPAIQQAGWGSSVPAQTLQKFGIPITGKQL